MPSNQSHLMQNFLRTCAPRRERLMYPRKSSQPLTLVSYYRVRSLSSTTIRIVPPLPALGQAEINHALLDLRASINLLLFSVYQQLGLGDLSLTRVKIQLADRSVKVLKGEINDVLIQVGEFIYPIDFIVLKTWTQF